MRLPIIDLGKKSSIVLGEEIRAAASSAGFFYVVNHGINFDSVYGELQNFFDLAQKDKMLIHPSNTNNFRGYVGFFEQGNYGVDETDVRKEETSKENLMDFKEIFHIGQELPKYHERYTDVLYSENIWPNHSESFKPVVEEYYNQVFDLSNTMFELFAIALGLEKSYFLNKSLQTPMNSMNCVHYPPLSEFPNQSKLSKDQLGIGEHTDFEAFTFIKPAWTKRTMFRYFPR